MSEREKTNKVIILSSALVETCKKDAWLKITTFGVEEYCKFKDFYILQRYIIVEPSIENYQKQFMEITKLVKKQSEPITLIVDELARMHILHSQEILSVLTELIRINNLELHCYSNGYVIGDLTNPKDVIMGRCIVVIHEETSNNFVA